MLFCFTKGYVSVDLTQINPKQVCEHKHLRDLFLINTAFRFTGWLLMDWICVNYCDVFISCLDSHSDGTHSLHRIHWWASDVILHFSKSVLINNGLRMSRSSANFNFWVNYSWTKSHTLSLSCFPCQWTRWVHCSSPGARDPVGQDRHCSEGKEGHCHQQDMDAWHSKNQAAVRHGERSRYPRTRHWKGLH